MMQELLLLKLAEIIGVEGVNSSIHHRLGRFKAWLRSDPISYLMECVADSCLLYLLHITDHIAYLSRAQ